MECVLIRIFCDGISIDSRDHRRGIAAKLIGVEDGKLLQEELNIGRFEEPVGATVSVDPSVVELIRGTALSRESQCIW